MRSTKSKVTQPEMCMYKQSVSENISEIYTIGIKITVKAQAHKCLFSGTPCTVVCYFLIFGFHKKTLN